MRRVPALLFSCLLAGAALAGCTSRDGVQTGSTARELLPQAREAAQAWQEDAVLVGIVTLEVRNGTEFLARVGSDEGDPWDFEDKARHMAHDDPALGDGRAFAWGYMFRSEGAAAGRNIILDTNGEILSSIEAKSSFETPEGATLDAWRLDSDAAWDAARSWNASMAASLESAAMAGTTLFSFNATLHPVWFLFAEDEGHEDLLALVVDAENGTVYTFPEFLEAILGGIMPKLQESGSAGNLLTPLRPMDEHDIELEQDGHATLVLALGTLESTPPGTRVQLTLRDEAGNPVLLLNHTRPTAPFQSADHAALVPAGLNYTATVELDPLGPSGVQAIYFLSWCTEGLPTDPFPPEACGFVELAAQGPKAAPAVPLR